MTSNCHSLPPVAALSPGREFFPVSLRPGVLVDLLRFPDVPVGIAREARTHRLVAVRDIPAGTLLFRIEGEPTNQPTRYSVQVGEGMHIDLGHGHSDQEIFEHYFWRFLNHSCNPNVLIRDQAVHALRFIAAGDDVTFDYNTTEYDMDEPFLCQCTSSDCLGTIQGFRHLTREQQERLVPLLPPHLLKYLGSDPDARG